MESLKPSAYNYHVALPDGTKLWFNFFTLSLIAFDSMDASLVHDIIRKPNASRRDSRRAVEIKKRLKDNGFLINRAVSEIDYIKQGYFKQRDAQKKDLSLTILPTLACNFRCIYCYEKHDALSMTPEVEEALIKMVDQNLSEKGSLFVTWFGGEPLLKLGTIGRLSSSFNEICTKKSGKYSSQVVTNGFLFNRENAESLRKNSVNNVQITLDGPGHIHDQRRPGVNGEKTFDAIISNIRDSAGIVPVNLRINVDQTNRKYIPELLELLSREGLAENVHPYLGRTYPYTEVCRDIAGQCLSAEDFSLLELETSMELINKGFFTFKIPRAVNIHCMAEKANAFVVTPSGGIVNCWNDASNPDAEIGHLLKPSTPQMEKNAQSWSQYNPFSSECSGCLLLPVCMGGCPYMSRSTGKPYCHEWKYHMDESLAMYYYLKTMEEQGRIIKEFQETVQEVKKIKILINEEVWR
ncbi:MAG: radical SAM protein [Deltaproteobacteria bacterium]|nr:radical SAM protein [Deltaproteobacteria bacterium]